MSETSARLTVEAAIDEYLDGYEFEGDEGSHSPGDFERFVIKDAIMGLLVDPDFISAFSRPSLTPAPVSREPVAWYDPTNRNPGQSVTFDRAKHEKWPHMAVDASAADDEAKRFATEVNAAYGNLITKQRNLDSDIAKALADNAWDLYDAAPSTKHQSADSEGGEVEDGTRKRMWFGGVSLAPRRAQRFEMPNGERVMTPEHNLELARVSE